MNLYDVIVRPLVTEKKVTKKEEEGTLAFEVAPGATKTEIKHAVEKLFKVKVVKVRTQTRVGKPRRHRNRMTLTPAWKKAIVTLKEGDKISLT